MVSISARIAALSRAGQRGRVGGDRGGMGERRGRAAGGFRTAQLAHPRGLAHRDRQVLVAGRGVERFSRKS